MLRVGFQVGHAQASDDFSSFVSNDLSSGGINGVDLAVQVLQRELEASKSVNQRHCSLHEQISSFSAVSLVLFFLHNEDQIPRNRVRLN